MTKVYMLSSGSYSNYGVVAIFSTLEKLQQYVVAFPRSGYSEGYNDVEEFELDLGISEIERGLLHFLVIMKRNGDVDYAEQQCNDADVQGYRSPQWTQNGNAYFHMWAMDAQHAIKIANERRIAMLAQTAP